MPINPNDKLATGNPTGIVTIDPGGAITDQVQFYRYNGDQNVYTNSLYKAPAAPQTKPITLDVPSVVAPPVLPTPTAPDTHETFLNSQTSTLEASRKAVEDAYKKQLDDIAAKKAESQKRLDQLTQNEGDVISGPVKDLQSPFRAELENSERSKFQVEENYQANQKLVNELDGLLTEGNALVAKMKEQKVPGLAGLQQSPRMVNALNNISARVGVINAVMAARNNQITVAENMIDRSVAATNADRKDQLAYYQTLLNFFDQQRDEEGAKLVDLNKEEKSFLTAQIGLLEGDLKTSQANADYIKGLMIDPETAKMVAESGVTLNDSPETINKKFTTYINNQQLQAEQKANRLQAQAAGVGTQFYETADGEVRMTQTGYAFPTPEDFKAKTGMTLQEAQAKGLITKIALAEDFSKAPADIQMYEYAKKQGYKGTFQQWLDRPSQYKGSGTNPTESYAVGLYGDTVDAALAEGASPTEAVLAAVTTADSTGTKLSLKDQNALLEYATGKVTADAMAKEAAAKNQPAAPQPSTYDTLLEQAKQGKLPSDAWKTRGLTDEQFRILIDTNAMNSGIPGLVNDIANFFKPTK